MNRKRWMIGRLALSVLVGLVTFVSGAWGALALWYQFPGNSAVRTAGSVFWVLLVIALAIVAISRRSWLPLAVYVVAFAALLAWWSTIRPSNQHVWSDDVTRLMSGKIDGNHVTLANVRNFTWRTEDDHDIRW